MADKTYVGKGWSSKFGIRISIKKADIEKLPTNKYGDVLLEVLQRREPDEKSKATHYVIVDDYGYEKMNAGPKSDVDAAASAPEVPATQPEKDDLPF